MIRNKDFLVLLIRLFLGYIFFSAGVCKLTHGHFGQIIGPPWLEESLAKYGLGFFAQVVAAMQVICGTLLFSQRFSTLGAIMLVPMNISILAVTVSMNWAGTPYVNAVFLLLNILLLAYEYQKFRFLFLPVNSIPAQAVPLDIFRESYLTWAMVASGIITLLVAPHHNLLTNIFGALTFLLAGIAVCVPLILNNLQKVIVALAILNMLIITVLTKITAAPKVIAGNTLLIFLLLIGCLIIRNRKPEPVVAQV